MKVFVDDLACLIREKEQTRVVEAIKFSTLIRLRYLERMGKNELTKKVYMSKDVA